MLEDLPAVVGAEIVWALAPIAADAGCVTAAVAAAESGYTVATRSFDAPHMRFNIADAHASALLLAGRVAEALQVAERVRSQATELPLSASGHATGWGYRYQVPRITALAIRGSSHPAAAALAVLDQVRRPFRSLDDEHSLARAWVAAAQGAVSEAIAVVLAAAERTAADGRFATSGIKLPFVEDRAGVRNPELQPVADSHAVGVVGPKVGVLVVELGDGVAGCRKCAGNGQVLIERHVPATHCQQCQVGRGPRTDLRQTLSAGRRVPDPPISGWCPGPAW